MKKIILALAALAILATLKSDETQDTRTMFLQQELLFLESDWEQKNLELVEQLARAGDNLIERVKIIKTFEPELEEIESRIEEVEALIIEVKREKQESEPIETSPTIPISTPNNFEPNNFVPNNFVNKNHVEQPVVINHVISRGRGSSVTSAPSTRQNRPRASSRIVVSHNTDNRQIPPTEQRRRTTPSSNRATSSTTSSPASRRYKDSTKNQTPQEVVNPKQKFRSIIQ